LTGFEFLPLLSFKVVVTALVVVAISAAIEHSGPVVGGVLMGLPITAGPGYVFLALQSTPHFVAQSALFSFAIVSANMIYVAIYLLAVRHFRPFATTTICLAGWFACALVVRAAPSSLWFGLGLNSALFIASLPLIRTPRSPLQRLRRMADRREPRGLPSVELRIKSPYRDAVHTPEVSDKVGIVAVLGCVKESACPTLTIPQRKAPRCSEDGFDFAEVTPRRRSRPNRNDLPITTCGKNKTTTLSYNPALWRRLAF
jgi:hypothetical protein